MKTIVRVPATTANLGPGFDVLGLALRLWNELEIVRLTNSEGVSIEIEGFGEGDLPTTEENEIIRALLAAFERRGETVPGLELRSRNGIPTGSGLGSSSAAVLAGILGANSLLSEPLVRSEVLSLASDLEGHPDNVTPGLLGGLTAAIVSDGRLVARKFEIAPDWRVAVGVPRFNAPTAAMRRALPEQVALADAVYGIGRAVLVARAFEDGDLELLREAMDDRLHEPFRLPRIPGAAEAVALAREAGAAAALSGAGPGVAAFTLGKAAAGLAAEAIERGFAQAGQGCWRWVGGVDRTGAVVGAAGTD